ncbi:hypothetical protein DFH06DRAFT_1325215 [Mycena polygramma]|nr:hypothetical protein DFH06DRAFT_1325215 [Mycena polygramma]
MTRLSDAPRQYTDSEFDALIAGLTDLDLAASAAQDARASTPPPPDYSPPVTPHITRLYQFESPTRSGCTTQWSEASVLTQGQPNSFVHTVWASPRSRHKKNAYAVFYGRKPGVYKKWFGPHGAEAQVKKVSGALFQGYFNDVEAMAAYRYAQERGWTAVRGLQPPPPGPPPPGPSPPSPPPLSSASRRIREQPSPSTAPPHLSPTLPQPLDSGTIGHNPLQGSCTSEARWHVVYAGITPGVYASYLECALNTIGMSGASYDSAESREDAEQRWLIAQAEGNIRTLTHPYHAHV